jgi:DNA invertase Pin-like site-specific DNA recombinase
MFRSRRQIRPAVPGCRVRRRTHVAARTLHVAELRADADPFMLHIYAALAEKERRMDFSPNRAALKAAKARGVVLGNPQKAARNRELAQVEAENLRSVLTELKHLSSRQIAAELTLRGVATPRRGKWQSPTVLRMIDRLGLR